MDYTLAKVREGYGSNNAIGYPHEERMAGREGIHQCKAISYSNRNKYWLPLERGCP
jgi:hypothetical protein